MDDLDYINNEIIQKGEEDLFSFLTFPIFNATENKPIGTGFFISQDGIFVTAAHNFKSPSSDHRVYLHSSFYSIELLYMEYDPSQNKDLVFGKLIGYLSLHNIPIYKIDFENEFNFKDGDSFSITGFKSKVLNDSEYVKEISINKDLTEYQMRIKSTLFDYSYNSLIKEEIEISGNSIYPFTQQLHTDFLKGFSGGPVYKDHKIYGMVISKFFVRMDYILKKLKNAEQNLLINQKK